MMHRFLMSMFALLGAAIVHAPAHAQNAKPVSTSSVGPWEAVVWGNGATVIRCTLSRAKPLADGTSYGFLVDHEVLFGLNNRQFAFAKDAKLQPVLTPAGQAARRVSAEAVAPTRANILLPRAMLDDLQKADHLDVEIAGRKLRLPFDDFNAARVVLEVCVQKLGKKSVSRAVKPGRPDRHIHPPSATG